MEDSAKSIFSHGISVSATQSLQALKKGMVIIMNEQLRILEMIEKGQITAAEGLELINALNKGKESEQLNTVEVVNQLPKRKYRFLKVKVHSDNNKINVNVNVPVRLLSTIGSITGRLTAVIPADARKDLESQGIDISSIDIAQIIEDILDGTVEDPNVIDVEAWDEGNQTTIKVKVYVD